MLVKVRGHEYVLDQIGDEQKQIIRFVNKEPGMERPGITMQELCRVGVQRTMYCHNCLPHRVNFDIVWHFRQIIALHEARAIEQQVAKGYFTPEDISLHTNGHFDLYALSQDPTRDPKAEHEMKPVPPLGHQVCDHRSKE